MTFLLFWIATTIVALALIVAQIWYDARFNDKMYNFLNVMIAWACALIPIINCLVIIDRLGYFASDFYRKFKKGSR